MWWDLVVEAMDLLRQHTDASSRRLRMKTFGRVAVWSLACDVLDHKMAC